MRLAEIVAGFDLATEYLAVAGDLNSEPDSWSLEPLMQNSHLYNVNLELPENDRGTYQGRKQQIDYILVSDALKARLAGVSIERRGAFSKSAWQPYPTVTSRSTAASDHCAVVADFTL